VSDDSLPADEQQQEAPSAARDGFRVALPNFEGPLDLLLHLIREHRLDILDIPLALITERYLETLERMREIDLDIAGEFLVMAATLAHLKSRMLLPRTDGTPAGEAEVASVVEEAGDPRADLVRRLLEYQKYRDAAEQLAKQDVLGRDVFTRNVPVEEVPIPDEEVGLVEISIYRLIEALDRLLQELAPKLQHQVVREQVSLRETLKAIASRVREDPQLSFRSLFEGERQRHRIIITFLALLEMCKLRLIRVLQAEEGGDIILSPNGDALERFFAQGVSEIDDGDYR
jgi:segregation and condensation protein A